MRFCIIGLGIYGSNLAKDLTSMGHEVIGADLRAVNVEGIKNLISTAYILDATDESSLAVLPLNNVDVVIVSIGENFGASVKTVALLKKLGVKHIFARSIDPLHQAILEGMEVDRILTPEQRAAWDLVHEMEIGANVESMAVADDNFVLQFVVPEFFVGIHYADINLEKDYGLKLIAVASIRNQRNIMGIRKSHLTIATSDELTTMRVAEGDQWTCYGPRKSFKSLFRHIN